MTPEALYDSTFEDGDLVVLITDQDVFDFGLLYTLTDGVELRSDFSPTRTYRWDQIRFMAHDGMPVNKIMGLAEPDDILSAATQRASRARELMRDKASRPLPRSSPRSSRYEGSVILPPPRGVSFGDPWEAELIAPVLFEHPDPHEECIVFGDTIDRGHGGDAGILWDLGTVLELEEPIR